MFNVCRYIGGDLVSIHDEKQNRAVFEAAVSLLRPDEQVWKYCSTHAELSSP